MSDQHSSKLSRRGFLKRAAIVGALAAVPGVVASRYLSGTADDPAQTVAISPESPIPMVAYIRNATKGEVVIMVGDQEIVVKDRRLVANLIGATQSGQV